MVCVFVINTVCTCVSLREFHSFPFVQTLNMLVQKLSWITLLLFLYQQGAEAKITQACEGGSAYLSCDLGFITVIKANYGRTDRTTCASGKPANQISNTHCFRETSLHTMSSRCDGIKSCTVPAVNSVFSDPCYGTYKYLDVSYECILAKRSVICESTQSVIVCDTGAIFVHHANYGRRDLETCPHQLATTPHCYSPQTSSLRSRCNGRKSCQLNASNSEFSDPCRGVHKYLEVTYSCLQKDEPKMDEPKKQKSSNGTSSSSSGRSLPGEHAFSASWGIVVQILKYLKTALSQNL